MVKMKKDYEKKALEVARLVKAKSIAYGNSISKTAKVLEIMYGDSIPKECYGDLHYIVRIFDKLSRLTQGDKMAFDEDPWFDIAGYALNRLVSEGDLSDRVSSRRCPVCDIELIKYLEDSFAYYACPHCNHYERVY